VSTTFRTPEGHAVYQRWCEITGLDKGAPDWGEVMQVLADSGLLEAADRSEQWTLFDDPAHGAEAPAFRQLRLAVVGGALLSQITGQVDIASSVSVVTTLLTHHYGAMRDVSFEQALTRLEVEVPQRVIQVVRSPADALTWLITQVVDGSELTAVVQQCPELALVLRLAGLNDAFAREVFEALAEDPIRRLALAEMPCGSWLLYHCNA
jgi:hypothetical protein